MNKGKKGGKEIWTPSKTKKKTYFFQTFIISGLDWKQW